MSTTPPPRLCHVDVIIPVHNASETIVETVTSAMNQTIPQHLQSACSSVVDVAVCCHNDGSTDESWELLLKLEKDFADKPQDDNDERTYTKLLISENKDGIARGAGHARNQAVALRSINQDDYAPHFLCLLDSDDTMHETRVAEQVCAMLALDDKTRERTIMGCTFDRDPPDSTWHYAQWANGLSDERLSLERFREVTVLQPTWFMTKSRFQTLGGYVEAPHPNAVKDDWSIETYIESLQQESRKDDAIPLVHSTFDTPQNLRLAEDLRLFHSHLLANGLLRLLRTTQPLVTYRHRAGMSQSSSTPRKLLLHLRVMAFERAILCGSDSTWSGPFVVWGAGRDGKDFCKALSEPVRQRVACFVDVDEKKIESGYYVYKEMDIRIPIVHFSWLFKDRSEADGEVIFGRIDKGRNEKEAIDSREAGDGPDNKKRGKQGQPLPMKRSKSKVPKELDMGLLPKLPVVVCVAMYRTNGALEANVKSVGRIEGKDLWHFS